MGLKGDIYKALVKNLGEEFINDSTKGQKKVDVLADFEQNEPKLEVDIFFIYPTLHSESKDLSWNSDIYKEETRNLVLESSVKYQSSLTMSSSLTD